MVWIPFWAAGVINGLGHHLGYRNYTTDDLSTNLVPWGFWIGGEELHNNHHAEPSSPKFSKAWYEVDLGWGWIKLLSALGLAQRRYEWLAHFQATLNGDLRGELRAHGFRSWRQLSRWAEKRPNLRASARRRLDAALMHPVLAQAHQLEKDLRDLWQTRKANAQQSLQAMEDWLEKARQQTWPGLQRFCDRLTATPAPIQA